MDLESGLRAAWAFVEGHPIQADLEELRGRCEALAPRSEDFETFYVDIAQEACFAVCALLDYLRTRDTTLILDVATYATDSVDLAVQEFESMDTRDPKLEERILSHPLMQAELRAQQDDLGLLAASDDLGRFRRERAKASSNLGLGMDRYV